MRYEIVESSPNAYFVRDNEAKRWSLPDRAVSLNLRKLAAEQIAKVLNAEWNAFLRNPS